MKKQLLNNAIKKLGLGVAVLGLALGTVGCGSNADNSSDSSDTAVAEEESTDEEVEEVEDTTEESDENAETGQLLWEDSDIKVSYTGISIDDLFNDPLVSLLVENNSDMSINMSIKDIFVNNYLCYEQDNFVSELEAGESANDHFRLNDQSGNNIIPDIVEKISNIKNIEMNITLSGSETGEVFAESQPLVITFKDTKPGKPLEIDSVKLKSEMSADEIKSLYTNDLGEPIGECNGLKFYYVSAKFYDYIGIALNLIVENTSDKDCYVNIAGKTLNGTEYSDGNFEDSSTLIPSGKRILSKFSLYDCENLGVNATTDIKELKTSVEVSDPTTYDVIATLDDMTIIGN